MWEWYTINSKSVCENNNEQLLDQRTDKILLVHSINNILTIIFTKNRIIYQAGGGEIL